MTPRKRLYLPLNQVTNLLRVERQRAIQANPEEVEGLTRAIRALADKYGKEWT